jgi:sulfur carrier protein ThiS
MRVKLGNGITAGLQEDFPKGCTVAQVMGLKGLNGTTVIAVLNGAVAHPDTALKEGDELELVGVIYGG